MTQWEALKKPSGVYTAVHRQIINRMKTDVACILKGEADDDPSI